jgi:hypothetical protein
MKKIILSAAVLAIAGFTTVKANSLNAKMQTAIIVNQADSLQKTPIKLEDLPVPVQTQLKADLFKTWIPTTAFDVKSGSNEYYEINVKKDADIKVIRFDKDGKVVQ